MNKIFSKRLFLFRACSGIQKADSICMCVCVGGVGGFWGGGVKCWCNNRALKEGCKVVMMKHTEFIQ